MEMNEVRKVVDEELWKKVLILGICEVNTNKVNRNGKGRFLRGDLARKSARLVLRNECFSKLRKLKKVGNEL